MQVLKSKKKTICVLLYRFDLDLILILYRFDLVKHTFRCVTKRTLRVKR